MPDKTPLTINSASNLSMAYQPEDNAACFISYLSFASPTCSTFYVDLLLTILLVFFLLLILLLPLLLIIINRNSSKKIENFCQ